MNKGVNIPTGWREVKLENSGLKVIDGDRGKKYPNGNDFSNSGYCLFMNAGNVTSSGFLFKENIFITKEKDEELRKGKLKRGDLVLTTRGSIGNIAYYDKNILFDHLRINSGMVIIRNSDRYIDTDFIYKLFRSPKFLKQINKISFGSAQPQLTVGDINKIKILLPPLQEQKVIADILEKWDGAIEKTSKLIEAKKKRFEWVRKFSLTTKKDWENIKLKDFLIESNQKSQIENEYKILSSTMNSVEIRSGRVDAVSNIGYKIIRRNQLVLSPQNLWLGNINVNTDYEVGLVSPSYKIFDFNENIILSDFAKFLFKTNKMLWNYKLCSEAGASVVRRNLDLNLFYEIKIFIPALEQQKQIAKTLNTAKKEITILEEILANYKSQKKGLMQKLLTGKIRVNNINSTNI